MGRISIKTIRRSVSALCLVLLLLIIQGVKIQGVAAPKNVDLFQIDFIDVGQGDATLVQCDGHYMLVDGGDADKSSLIYSYLKNRSISHLDVIIATHPDSDHIGGLPGALNYASVGTAYSPVSTYDSKDFQNFEKYIKKQGKTITVPKSGDKFSLGSASVTVLGPVKVSSESNNNSIVLRIEYGKTSFLLTGDAESEEEESILNSKKKIQSTVIKIAHHGSSDSTGDNFLREVSPKYAVISVGTDNTYGHPAESVLNRLSNSNVKTYRTDLQGDIICKSDGTKVEFSVKKNADANTFSNDGQLKKSTDKTDVNNLSTNASGDTKSTSQPEEKQVSTDGSKEIEATYILNTNTKKFHSPTCSSVYKMKEKNKMTYTGSRDSIISQGYEPCKNCNP